MQHVYLMKYLVKIQTTNCKSIYSKFRYLESIWCGYSWHFIKKAAFGWFTLNMVAIKKDGYKDIDTKVVWHSEKGDPIKLLQGVRKAGSTSDFNESIDDSIKKNYLT